MKNWFKKCIHTFVINENGAVSIYAIMITLLLFIFNAVLIDYVRIMAAERNVDQAIKAATRSTMASFDKSLMGDYGLFGFKGEALDIFEKVLKEHLEIEGNDYFKFAEASVVEGSAKIDFNEEMMLATPDTFSYQILEDMKYKAPLQIGEAILEGFLSVSDEMEKASNFVDVAAELQKKVDEREEKLNEVKKELDNAKKKIEPLEKNFIGGSVRGIFSTYPNVNSLKDIVEHLDRFKEDTETIDDDSAEDNDKAKDNVKTFKEESEKVVKALNKDLKELNGHLIKAEDALKKAKSLNDDAIELLNKKDASNDYGNAQDARDTLAEGSNVNAGNAGEGLDEGMKALEDLIIDEEFFENMLNPLEDAIYKTSTERGGDTLYNYLQSKVKEIDNGNIENALLTSTNIAMIDRKVNEFNEGKTKIDEVLSEFEKRPQMKEEDGVKEKEEEANENFDEAAKLLEESVGVAVDFANYQELLGKVAKYSEFAEMDRERKELDSETKEDLADSSMDIVDLIFGAIGDVLLNSRDKAYINEYILMRFSHHNFNSRGAKKAGSSESEVEFILYGLGTPQLNVGAALGEIFAVRFAVNFIEAFTQKEVRAFGKFMFIAALSYAFLQTASDMKDIFQGRKFKFIEVGPEFLTGYEDYLRLFLFMHPEGKKMQRSLARIDQKTGNDLTEMGTYLEGEVQASVKLWFLPGVASILSDTGVLNGEVEDGEFFIRKKAIYSY